MKPEEIIEKWKGYLDLVKRAEAFLLISGGELEALEVGKDGVSIRYLVRACGDIDYKSYFVPMKYFCRTDKEAVEEFFEMKKQQDEKEKRRLKKEQKLREKEEEKEMLAHLIKKYKI